MASIAVENVSVELPVFNVHQRSLRHELLRFGSAGFIALDRRARVVIKALQNISFRVDHGDRLALIGRNGAGKTTLLRVIAGVWLPVEGKVTVEGRVSTLFDIGSFMDPELSGFENIFYGLTMLGIRPREIRALTPSIAEFTELEDYLHMPLRTFSAGMQVRLSFAIATSIDPEILLLDEAISAGDAHFMEKARTRAEEIYYRSSILVIASHSKELVRSLCNKALLLDRGHVIGNGSVDEMLAEYESLDRGGDAGPADSPSATAGAAS